MTAKNSKYANEFAEVAKKSIDDQAGQFLRAFVLEFQGRFEEILELSTEFKKYLLEGASELEEDALHRFLEVLFSSPPPSSLFFLHSPFPLI